MTKKQREILNDCIDLLLTDGENTKYKVSKILNDLIIADILKENRK